MTATAATQVAHGENRQCGAGVETVKQQHSCMQPAAVARRRPTNRHVRMCLTLGPEASLSDSRACSRGAMLHTSLLGRCGACVLRASLPNDSVCTISSLRPQPGLADPRAREGLWGAACGANNTGRREVVAHGVRSVKRFRGAVLSLKLGRIEQAAQQVRTHGSAPGHCLQAHPPQP